MNLRHLLAFCIYLCYYSIGEDAQKRKWREQSVTTFLRFAGSAVRSYEYMRGIFFASKFPETRH